jgi:hypothetical protein
MAPRKVLTPNEKFAALVETAVGAMQNSNAMLARSATRGERLRL